jgi:Carboxypeptidase regulatory-like domain/TonB-dependent Receptor Plug Domain
MNRIRGGATVLGLALLLAGGVAHGQETTGRVTGRVSDQDTGMPIAGVTVIMQGPQGEDATLTDDRGDYRFSALPIGTYVIRFYAANTSAQVEQPGVVVQADKMVRVNTKIAGSVQGAAQQTYVITGKAPSIDIGSARIGTQFDQDFDRNIPLGRTYGDVIERAPGAFVDGSGNVSIGGATGLENTYIVNGLNVTGIQYGNLESGASTIGGGSNIPLEFLTQIDVNSGGYQAEYGGAMGGVINSVLKSGSNEFHGSAFGYWSPYWLSGDPKVVLPLGTPFGSVRKPDFDDSIGAEVGGPLIKDKLFFWFGFAPRIINSHVFRLTYAESEDPNNLGNPVLNANGLPALHQLPDWTARINETHRTYYYAGTIDWVPLPDNKLTVALMGTPSFNKEVGNGFGSDSVSGRPDLAVESLTKTNTDATAHWVSKLFDRHWQIDASAGMHSEYYYDRSPNAALNDVPAVQYGATNVWDLEHAPGCAPTMDGFEPCPISPYGPYYHTGGFGEIDKYDAFRWSGELKSTNLFEAAGRHELKYGWHVDLSTLDLDRRFSGNGFNYQVFPGGGTYNSSNFFTLSPGENATNYTTGLSPTSNLLYSPDFRSDLHAYVKSLSDAFFLQDSYSPSHLRNLTINVGGRLELQKIYDFQGTSFLDTSSFAPRLSAVYDPFNDGRSKISFSYGRFYEAVPLDVAARYFGGENFLNRQGVPLSNCPGAVANPYQWTANCTQPAAGQPDPHGMAFFNSEYAQPNLQGQYHNEIVATAEREIMEGTTVRIDYQHRWLGTIIEDGSGPGYANGVLANPGHVPQSALDAAQHLANQATAAANANPNDPILASAATGAQYNLATLQTLAAAPPPERTYNAVTLSLNKKLSKRWFARASYTYSRLIGNYEGLYQNETNYIAPNGNNAYDVPELYVNQNGPLPNDHPHLFHLDGFYTRPVGRGHLTFGLSFSARSGTPRSYISNLVPQTPYQIVFLLPRGDAGRSPTLTQLNGKISYGRPISPQVSLEGFVDFFNILDQQTPTMIDDNYTFDAAPPIVNGTPQDLKFAKNAAGAPIAKNPDFGQPLAYQTPFNCRLGVRLTF